MQQNLINYRQRISEIVYPAPFFRQRKRSETLKTEPPQLKKKVQSLHLPELQLFASQDKSFEMNLSGFDTTFNQQQIIIFNDQEAKSLKKSVILSRNSSPKNRRLQRRGTLQMLDENDQRKFESWQSKFRRKADNDQLHAILNHFVELFAAMHLKHTRHLIDIYGDVAVQIQSNPIILIRFTLVIASFFLEMKEYNKSSFLCRQIFIISKMLSLNKERTKTLLFFAKIHQSLQQYQQSLKFLEDSLAYSWFGNQQDEEALSYEAMGLSLFYMQQQTKARVFHFKYVNGQFEPHNSPLRIQAIQQIAFSEQLQLERGEKQEELNDIVLAKLSLPFQTKERKKTIKKIDLTSYDDIFKSMITELSEAVQYEAIYLRDVQRVAPKMKIKEVGAFTEKFLETKRKATMLQWKQRERISSLTIDRNLKEYIKQRNKSIENCELIFKRVKDSVGFKQQKELEPIYIQQYQNKNVIQYIKKEFEQQLLA